MFLVQRKSKPIRGLDVAGCYVTCLRRSEQNSDSIRSKVRAQDDGDESLVV